MEWLRVPQATGPPARVDRLWQHTCFELFARAPQGAAYAEFNFAPSGEWAAYRFDGYRQGMRVLPVTAPLMTFVLEKGRCVLTVALVVPEFADGTVQLAAATVLEDQEGGISYWALRHPEGKPDFHHASGFLAQV